MAGKSVGYGVVGTNRQTVETNHAAAHVGHVVVEIDTRSLANVDAAPALRAAVGVYVDMKGRVARNQTQRRRQWTQGVTQPTPAPVCHKAGYAEQNPADNSRQSYGPRCQPFYD